MTAHFTSSRLQTMAIYGCSTGVPILVRFVKCVFYLSVYVFLLLLVFISIYIM